MSKHFNLVISTSVFIPSIDDQFQVLINYTGLEIVKFVHLYSIVNSTEVKGLFNSVKTIWLCILTLQYSYHWL